MDEIIAAAFDLVAAIEADPGGEFNDAIDKLLVPDVQISEQEKWALDKVVTILKATKGILS